MAKAYESLPGGEGMLAGKGPGNEALQATGSVAPSQASVSPLQQGDVQATHTGVSSVVVLEFHLQTVWTRSKAHAAVEDNRNAKLIARCQ